jgi:hypothetical protein
LTRDDDDEYEAFADEQVEDSLFEEDDDPVSEQAEQ